PIEREHLGVLFARDGDDARTAVDCLYFLAATLRIDRRRYRIKEGGLSSKPSDPVAFGIHPTRVATIEKMSLHGEPIGVVGEVDPEVLESIDASGRRVGWLSLDLKRFLRLERLAERARPVSRFPSSDIDLSFAVPDDVSVERLEALLEEAAGEWVERVDLVDVYRGDGLAQGTRSLTYRIRFSALDRTLTDADVSAARARCIAAAETETGAVLRG
ncbi:MAG: hypothetical protein WB770_10755, partial [Acidimicrobiales bacterium]